MEAKYEMIIYWSSEDNVFIVEVPELPGCMADGRTYQEAVMNADTSSSVKDKRSKVLHWWGVER